MQRDFWLLTRGCLSRCDHSCRLRVCRYSGGADSEGLVEIRSRSPQGSRRRADDGGASAGLSAETHGNFGLRASLRRPVEKNTGSKRWLFKYNIYIFSLVVQIKCRTYGTCVI